MMQLPVRLAAILVWAALAGPVTGQEADDFAAAFVSEFAASCLPERRSFEGSARLAVASGWSAFKGKAQPELAGMLEKGREIVASMVADAGIELSFDQRAFEKTVAGRKLHLLVVRVATGLAGTQPRNAYLSCYLYDLDATATIDSGLVESVVGSAAADSVIDPDLVSHSWTAPASLPGTSDLHLTFVPEGSPHQESTAFSGLSLMLTSLELVSP